ncbi:hypothetical protein ABPG72_003644 [Tetrahymena utriculariae]
MQKHFEQYIEALNQGKIDVCIELCKLENISEKDILSSCSFINSTLLNQIKENLHTLKSKFLYDYLFSIYQKGCKISVYFDSANIFKEDDSQISSENPTDELSVSTTTVYALSSPLFNIDIFLLCVSHMNNLMTQKIISLELKQLMNSILLMISLFAEEKEVQNISRRQKFINNFIKLFNDILVNSKPSDTNPIDQNIAVLCTHILAKLSNRSKKNQDYLIRKKAHEIFKAILMSGDKNILIFQATAGLISNLAHNQDSRLLMWTSGVLNICKKLLISCQNNLKIVEFSYIIIMKLAQECKEVVEDIKNDQQFMDNLNLILAQQDLMDIKIQKSENLSIFGLAVGILRKIAGFQDFRAIVLKKYSKYPLNYIIKNQSIVSTGPSQIVQTFVQKEVLALIGVFAIEEEGRQLVLRQVPKLSSSIIKICLNSFEDSKLVKVSLGCLTNLSVLEQSREEVSKEKDFYILIFSTIEKYDYSSGMLEYCLKMILNNCSNQVSFKNFSVPKLILKLLFLGFAYQSNILIVDLTSKILKALSTNAIVLQNIIKCFREYENSNQSYKYSSVVVSQLKILITNNLLDSVLDLIILIACICTVDKQFINELQEKTEFLSVIKDILDTNRQNPKDLQRLSSSLAFLPLEEFKGLILI